MILGRPSRSPGPLWPLAWELAQLGTPIGVWVCPCESGEWAVVSVTPDGELVELVRCAPDTERRHGLRGSHQRLAMHAVRWAVARSLRVYPRLSGLVEFVQFGHGLGWVPGRIYEHRPKRAPVLVCAVPFRAVLPGEEPEEGAELVPFDLA